MITSSSPLIGYIGYPSRPKGGGVLPKDFKLLRNEVLTPKLNGDRVLMSNKGKVYNRQMQKYSKMDADDAVMVHQILNHPNHSPCKNGDVLWWDIEYMSHGINRGCFCVIDCVVNGDDDYFSRLSRYDELPTISPRDQKTEFKNEPKNTRNGWRFPIYDDAEGAQLIWEDMEYDYKAYLNYGQENDYIWEGLVRQVTDQPYELTPKQSMNMTTQIKYRFR